MTLPCSTCLHYKASEVMGRLHEGCMRPGLALDGKTITPPLRGFSVQFQRSPPSSLDWQAPDDRCSVEGKFHTDRQA